MKLRIYSCDRKPLDNMDAVCGLLETQPWAVLNACTARACAQVIKAVRQTNQKILTPRPLQEKATKNSSPQSSQRTRAKPWANSACPELVEGPHSKYLRKAFST